MITHRRGAIKLLAGGSLSALAFMQTPAAFAQAGAQYKNPSAPISVRVADLMARMTLDEKTPLYPFGYGLSYTDFTFGAPSVSAASIAGGQGVTVRVPVTNSGAMAGDEVVQVYLRDEVSSVTRPVKELVGFQRVTLAPGETKNVDIVVEPRSFMLWNRDMERVIEPGEFTIMVGPNSEDLQSVTLTVTP